MSNSPGRLADKGPRAAIVASTPIELAERIQLLLEMVAQRVDERLDTESGIYLGNKKRQVTLLFPGQGAIPRRERGAAARRFPRHHADAERLAGRVSDPRCAEQMQPALVAAALASLHLLEDAGVEADAAIGHSLGELVALHWAGVFDEETLIELARIRGRAMDMCADAGGSMLAIAAPGDRVHRLIAGTDVVIAAYNAPNQTVVSGTARQVQEVCVRARTGGWAASEPEGDARLSTLH